MMDNKSIRNYMNGLAIRCKELNELHNNYDVDTRTETEYRQSLIEDIKYFNSCQNSWTATLKPCMKGWYIKYE